VALKNNNFIEIQNLSSDNGLKVVRPAFIFAHPDDSVLSAYYAMWTAESFGLDIVACCGFPATDVPGDWDVRCNFKSALRACGTRIEEHQQVCALTQNKFLALELLDSQYGGSGELAWADAWTRTVRALQDFDARLVITHSTRATHPDHQYVACFARRLARHLNFLSLTHVIGRILGASRFL